MPTIEERLEALERTVPVLRAERASEIRELEARVYEQIDALRQQLAEQQWRLSAHEQATQQKFETLIDVILQQSQALSQQFSVVNARLDALETNIRVRFDAQTIAIRAQFENMSVPLTMLTTTAGRQGQDIKALKNDVTIIKEQLADVKQDNTEFYIRFDRLEKRLEATNQQVVEVRQDMNGRFEQVDQRFEMTNQQIAEVRQDMNGRFEMTNQQIAEVRQEVTEVRQEVTEVRQEVTEVRQDMNSRFKLVDQRFDMQDVKFDQVLQQLAAITMKLDQGRGL